MKGHKGNPIRQAWATRRKEGARRPENGTTGQRVGPRTPPEAPDAAAAVALAQSKLDSRPDADHVVVPICPSGVKQREVAALTASLGLHCARMGTGASRWLVVSRRPLRLLFRDLSPDTRAHLQRYAGVRLFAVRPRDDPDGRDCDDDDDKDCDHYGDDHADKRCETHGKGKSQSGGTEAGRVDRYVTAPHVDSADLLATVTRAIVTLGGEKRLVDLHRVTVARVLALLTASPAFAAWSQRPPPDTLEVPGVWPVPGDGPHTPASKAASIYCPANDGRCFVSVDIVAANFRALVHAGLIEQTSWEAFVARGDVLPDEGAVAYLARAKGLRMLALSQPALRPDLQRALWSRVAVGAFERLVAAGACALSDLAAWNSDEVIIHADDADDAVAKVASFGRILADAEWADALACRAFVLSTVTDGDGGLVGFRRTCLTTGRSAYKCIPPDRLCEVLFGGGSAISPVHAPCAAAVDGVFGAEAKACADALSWLVFDTDARAHGATTADVADRIAARGVPMPRAIDLASYVIDHRAALLVRPVDRGDDDSGDGAKRVRCAWAAAGTESTAAYRRRAWPAIGPGGADGPRCTLLPEGVQLIDTLDGCRRVTMALARQPAIAVDCEGISEGEIAMVQIHAPGGGGGGSGGITYFFDMLAPEACGGDAFLGAGGLGAVLASRCVVKVMHDARGDLSALARRYGRVVRGLFDTQIAHALVLGGVGVSPKAFTSGLNEVLAAHAQSTNADTGDDPTNADKKAVSRIMTCNRLCWHERPLTRRLLRYAAADVARLLDAYRGLMMALDSACRDEVMVLSDARADAAAGRT